MELKGIAALQSDRLNLFCIGGYVPRRKEGCDLIDYTSTLVRAKLGIHWQRKNIRGNPFANRKGSCWILKMTVGFLQVKRNRIMNTSSNSRFGQILLKSFALPYANHIQVIDRPRRIRTERRHYTVHGCESLVITVGNFWAVSIPFGQMAKFGGEKTGLQGIEAAVVAFDLVIILLGLAVIAKNAHGLSHGLVVSGYGTSFSARAKILSGIKAERGSVAHTSRFFPCVCRLGEVLSAVRLASIFDNNEFVFASESKYRIHISGLAIDMDRNDGGHGRLQLAVNERAGFRVQ